VGDGEIVGSLDVLRPGRKQGRLGVKNAAVSRRNPK